MKDTIPTLENNPVSSVEQDRVSSFTTFGIEEMILMLECLFVPSIIDQEMKAITSLNTTSLNEYIN